MSRKTGFIHHLWVALRHLLSGTIIGALLLYAFIFWVGSPSQWRLEKEHAVLQQRYRELNSRLDEALDVLHDIGERDDHLYRVVLQGEPIGQEARLRLSLNHARYDSLRQLSDADLVIRVEQKMDAVERQLYLQSRSFNELADLSRSKEDRLKHIPSIQPVRELDLRQLASGYGWRSDPIYGVRKFHEGMDFSANKGTAVYCTGNGRVIFSGWEQGYGMCIHISHGYGYETRFAHLNKSLVRNGQTVQRGDKIGEVGSTGKSTGPHLHYEVLLHGVPQNPAHYYYMDLTPEEYEVLLNEAENRGNVMD